MEKNSWQLCRVRVGCLQLAVAVHQTTLKITLIAGRLRGEWMVDG